MSQKPPKCVFFWETKSFVDRCTRMFVCITNHDTTFSGI